MAWPALLDTKVESVKETRKPQIPESRPSSKMKEGRGAHKLSEPSATLLKSSPITAEGHFISPSHAEQVQREAGPSPAKDDGETEGEKAGQATMLEGKDQSGERSNYLNKEHPGHGEETALFVIHEQDHPEPAIELPQQPGVDPNSLGEVPTVLDEVLPNNPDPVQQAGSSDDTSTTALIVDHPTTGAASGTASAGTASGADTPTTPSEPAGQDPVASGIDQHDHTIHRERGRHGRKGRVIRRARRVILRRKVLSVILGRELARTVHPLLQNPGAG
ncbi:hypothetical protein DV735_g2173, partial [Chaetothyriales sp. CBS 134920]